MDMIIKKNLQKKHDEIFEKFKEEMEKNEPGYLKSAKKCNRVISRAIASGEIKFPDESISP